MTTTPAQIILQQLDGNRFLAMTGARMLCDLGDGPFHRANRLRHAHLRGTSHLGAQRSEIAHKGFVRRENVRAPA